MAASQARQVGGVAWLSPGALPATDVAVAINDAGLLPGGGLPVVWFHNEVEFWREARKGRLAALWRHRPAGVFIGARQRRAAALLLPLRARITIPYGLPERVLAAAPAAAPPPPHAVFTSQAYRGLRGVIAMWRGQVAPRVPGARFSAFIDAADIAAYAALAEGEPSIAILPRVGNAAVIEMLRGARLLVAPGHRSETFCMAAAEAIAMGVPVVTQGIGSLAERVADGRTGFVCRRGGAAMARRIVEVLTDDGLWRSLHGGGLATRAGNGWAEAAGRWAAMARQLGAGS